MSLRTYLQTRKNLVNSFGMHRGTSIRQIVFCLAIALVLTVLTRVIINTYSFLSLDYVNAIRTTNQQSIYDAVTEPIGSSDLFPKITLIMDESNNRPTLLAALGNIKLLDQSLDLYQCDGGLPSLYYNVGSEYAERARTPIDSFIDKAFAANAKDADLRTKEEFLILKKFAALISSGAFKSYSDLRSSTSGTDDVEQKKLDTLYTAVVNEPKAMHNLISHGITAPKVFCLQQVKHSYPLPLHSEISVNYPLGAVLRAYEVAIRQAQDKEGVICGVTQKLDKQSTAFCRYTRALSNSWGNSTKGNHDAAVFRIGLVNGVFQFLTLLATWWLILFSILRTIVVVKFDSEVASRLDIPTETSSKRIHKAIDERIHNVTKALNSEKAAFGFVSIAANRSAYSVLHHTKKLSEVPAALDVIRTSFKSRMETNGAISDYLQWLIPTTGFLGTIYGIMQALSLVPAMQSPSPIQITDARIRIGEAVGIAFDTTFFALSMAILTVFIDRIARGIIQIHIDNTLDRVWWRLSKASNVLALLEPMADPIAAEAEEPDSPGKLFTPEKKEKPQVKKFPLAKVLIFGVLLLISMFLVFSEAGLAIRQDLQSIVSRFLS